MLNNVPIARKLGLLSAVFFLPVMILSWVIYDHDQRGIDLAANEDRGTAYFGQIIDLLQAVTYAEWDSSPSPDRLTSALTALEAFDRQQGADLRAESDLNRVRASVQAFAVQIQNPPATSFSGVVGQSEASLAVTAAALQLASEVGDRSSLVLDPDLDSYYVMDLVVFRLPTLLKGIDHAAEMLWEMKPATPMEKQKLLGQLGSLQDTIEAMEHSLLVAQRSNGDGSVAARLTPAFAHQRTALDDFRSTLDMNARMVQGGMDIDRPEVLRATRAFLQSSFELWRESSLVLSGLLQGRIDKLHMQFMVSAGASGLAVLLAFALSFLIGRSIRSSLAALQEQMIGLSEGVTDLTIPFLQRHDEIGRMARALEIFRENAVRSIRIRTALDCAARPVMVVDRHGILVELNQSARTHFAVHAASIRQDVPGFDIDTALGMNIVQFHKDPAVIQALLHSGSGVHATRLQLGERTFDLRINPVVSYLDEHLGSVAEWEDVTDRLRVEQQISQIMEQAIAGDFSQRVDSVTLAGFLRILADSTNQLLHTVQTSLNELVEVSSALAEGDLSRRIDRHYQGAFHTLTTDTNRMADRLAAIVRNIVEAAHAVHNASAEIAQGSEDLATRTEQQAASLEETAAAMEELAITVRQNANNAQQADHLASDARRAAEQGGDIITPTVMAMSRIEESSEKITEITTLIEEIAFQTNLLALNAAVEAARAGESGRGFAVVAAEVRQLAQHTSRSSKEIKELIQRSNAQVKDGVKMVGHLGSALSGIVHATHDVASIIGQIAAASREQSTGLDEVNTAIAQMDEMTQQNAALVEETTAAAHSLSVQAEGLVDLVSFFTINDPQNEASAQGFARHQVQDIPRDRPSPQPSPARSSGRGLRKGRGASSFADDHFEGEASEIAPLASRPARRVLGRTPPVDSDVSREGQMPLRAPTSGAPSSGAPTSGAARRASLSLRRPRAEDRAEDRSEARDPREVMINDDWSEY